MSTLVFNIHDAKTNLSRIVDDVAAGAEVIIAKAGKPMARLVPNDIPVRSKKLGLLKGKIHDHLKGVLSVALSLEISERR